MEYNKPSLSMAYAFLVAGEHDVALMTFNQVMTNWKNWIKRVLVL